MSVSEGSNNNKAPAPSPLLVSHSRDPKYYHDTWSVFLVGGSLFKFQASILAPNPSAQSYEFEPLMKDLLDPQNASTANIRGSSESNPLIIPNVEAEQFRNLLLILLGRPGEAEYMSLITGAQYTHNHNRDTFLRYFDIADLAVRFGISDLADWAWTQLDFLLGSSDTLADCEWDYATLTKIISHVDYISSDKEPVGRNMLYLCLLALGGPMSGLLKPKIDTGLNASTCLRFYRHPTHLEAGLGKMVFGYAFVAVLSLDQCSSVWVEEFTWQDRAALYATQYHLNSPDEIQDLAIERLRHPRKYFIDETTCPACSSRFDAAWQTSFAQCETLDPIEPPENLSTLLLLPRYRQQFAQTVRSDAWACGSQCGDKILLGIDVFIGSLYSVLVEKNANFVNNAWN